MPQTPPDLIVKYKDKSIKAWRGSFQWYCKDENGEDFMINSDSVAPMNIADKIEAITISNNATIVLNFEVAPTTIMVSQYKAKGSSYKYCKEITVENNSIKVKKGNYLYNIVATWDNETKKDDYMALYAFCTK